MSAPPRGAPTLVLVPTPLELGHLERLGGFAGRALTALCGFGPAAAGARAGALLARLTPARVVLVGIAGSYDGAALPVGAAASFGHVRSEGPGAEVPGGAPLGPRDLRLPQWSREGLEVWDELPLAGPGGGTLLTVSHASGDAFRARSRAADHGALAEDMEAFAVALACAEADVSLQVVRGISNLAGERDLARWRIADALAAARDLALELLP